MAKKKPDETPATPAETPGDLVLPVTGIVKQYQTSSVGTHEFLVTRDDDLSIRFRDRFVDESEAKRCFLLQHGEGRLGAIITVTRLS